MRNELDQLLASVADGGNLLAGCREADAHVSIGLQNARAGKSWPLMAGDPVGDINSEIAAIQDGLARSGKGMPCVVTSGRELLTVATINRHISAVSQRIPWVFFRPIPSGTSPVMMRLIRKCQADHAIRFKRRAKRLSRDRRKTQ